MILRTNADQISSLCSISVLAGGRLLITEHNLVEPGYVKVCFDRVHQTVAGQAVVRNNIYFASLDKDRYSPFSKRDKLSYEAAECDAL